jgi:hypothetical protein
MAINDAIQVDQDDLYPFGVFVVGAVQEVRDWDRSTREQPQQEVERDEAGEPVLVDGLPQLHWQVEVMDGDPSLTRDRTFFVRMVSARRPVPPEPVAGLPVAPVELVGLQVRFKVNKQSCRGPWNGQPHQCRARLAVEVYATELASPTGSRASARATVGNGTGASG